MANENEHTDRPSESGRRPGFTDASFTPRDQIPNMPKIYTYPEPREEKEREDGARRLRGSGVVLLCALCLVLGASLHWLYDRHAAPAADASPTAAPMVSAAPAASAAPENTPVPELTAGEIYTLACSQVVGVAPAEAAANRFGEEAENAVIAAGCVIRADGYILTSYRAVEDAVRAGTGLKVIFSDQEVYPAELVGYERSESDIAVLRINADGLRPVVPGELGTMRVGDGVYTVGHPLGELSYTTTPGILSAESRSFTVESDENGGSVGLELFQVSVPSLGGAAGGPVYNARGQAVGLLTVRFGGAGEGLGLAIPMTEALSLADDIMENGYVRGKPYLGIIVQTVTSAVADYYNQYYEDCMVVGVQVYAMDSGGPAAQAGIQRGDIITALDGRAVLTAAELTEAEKEYRSGDTVEVTLYRNGAYETVPLTFAERAPDAAPEAGW